MVSLARRRRLVLEERPIPRGRGKQVLVRVRGAGVCHTDLDLVDDPDLSRPLVLGHEIAGEAEGLGPVLVHPAWGCRRCAACRRGEEVQCPRGDMAGWTRDGGYAEWVLVPSARYLLPLGGLDPVRAAVLADAGLTPYRAVRRASAWLERGDVALVVGAGGLGQFAVQYLKLLTEAHVVAVDVAAARRARALRLGADEAVAPSMRPPPARVVLDFVGTGASVELATKAVGAGGLVVLVGAAGGEYRVGWDGTPYEAFFTIGVLGSLDDLAAVVEHARRGENEWEVETMPLERANEALARLRRGDVAGRFVLVP